MKGGNKKGHLVIERWPYVLAGNSIYSFVIFKVKLPELLINLIA